MTFILANRVRESANSPGTGTATLLGAALGYQSFSAGIGASNTTYYVIADQSGANWEVGYGTVGAGGTTLARTTVLSSSNAGSLVNFSSGVQDVWCDYPANKAVSLDSSGKLSFGGNGTGYADWASAAPTVAAGRMWYNGNDGSWNLGMGGGNITQQVGEELFVYGKASAAITDSPLQIIKQTAPVGSSGVVGFAPTTSGITNGDLIIGVATESLALNDFGRITCFGTVRGITTNGTAYGETWADGDVIWYNPVTGNPTNVKPVAPNIKVSVGVLIKAGSGGSGSINVEINHGSVLGGTDSNVQLTSATGGQILTYNQTGQYWSNVSLGAGTGFAATAGAGGSLSVGASVAAVGTWMGTPSSANLLAAITDETGSGLLVFNNSPTFITPTLGTPASGTLTNTTGFPAGNLAGTALPAAIVTSSLTSVGTIGTGTWQGTAIGAVYGGTGQTTVTAGDLLYGSAANTWSKLAKGTDGQVLRLVTGLPAWGTDYTGTVTSVSALTLGTTGTDLSSTVANSTTTPVITLNVPTASATNRGALSSTDWSTFNGKQAALVSGTNIKTVGGNSLLGSGDVGTIGVGYGGTGITSLTAGYVPFGAGSSAFASTSNFFFDSTNVRLGLGTATPNAKLHLNQATGSTAITLQQAATYAYLTNDGTNINLASHIGTTGLKVAIALGAPDSAMVITSTGALAFNGATSYGTSGQVLSSVGSTGSPVWKTTSYAVSYLIVGGGGGAASIGGGGGAGGFLTGTAPLIVGTVYSATVGGGGAGSPANFSTHGVSGDNSSFANLTAIGGGGGGTATPTAGYSGGSGGGSGGNDSASPTIGASGTAGQGNNGGNSCSNGTGGGGGGGAGAVGANGSSSGRVAGAGGNGTASSITGSSVTYAGGGGGGANQSTGGAGGSGGGGTGYGSTTNGGNGTANLGGGGGGGGSSNGISSGTSGNGGSGVVIISVPTANYSGTTTGSPTITTSGANTIIKFTSSGTYTA